MFDVSDIVAWFLIDNKAHRRTDNFVEPLTQMKLHKLLYYAQGVSLAAFDEPLFNNEILAWKHGPVVREIYDKYRGQTELNEEISEQTKEKCELVCQNEQACAVLEAVTQVYGNMSAWDLREQTHQEDPWKESYVVNGSEVIPQDLIADYFKREILVG
ncbi:Panacea domain-containing protein [Listeria fleischmannii]|uniref:Phage Cro/CI transcriptional regulator n=1 Tax=Listeria fleischmannii FSL S10-1203 TaxID=1265822 RepID=W7DSK6_9LIST|nr:type II toxin-antitoxin system antitoxin SocA domain-containing protein [Listeria fleischmannii]EUJ64865.1 phage Cro/CI transcriptional regulator [Listeria fleischmannii FSL S10-1203]